MSLPQYSISALVQRDGDIVDTLGNPIRIYTEKGNYFLSVSHRNHLGVMTKRAIVHGINADTVDFTTMADSAMFAFNKYDTLQQVKWYGKKALYAGNANQDNKVKYSGTSNDVSAISNDILNNPNNVAGSLNFLNCNGYYLGDINMDGKVLYLGLNSDPQVIRNSVFIYPLNVVQASNFNLFLEQIP
jgi:hypothetical protein